jgi:phage baseplate assembly protein W
MSTLEKNLYKRVTVSTNRGSQSVTQGSAYRGFSSINENVEGYALYDFDLIKQDIINHFHIRKGEKLSDPNFGTIIWDMLYEPFTTENKEAIIADVAEIINYDDRVTADQVFVDTTEDGIEVSALLTFLPYNISEQMLFKFDKQMLE